MEIAHKRGFSGSREGTARLDPRAVCRSALWRRRFATLRDPRENVRRISSRTATFAAFARGVVLDAALTPVLPVFSFPSSAWESSHLAPRDEVYTGGSHKTLPNKRNPSNALCDRSRK